MLKIYKSFEKLVLSAGDYLLLKKLEYSEWKAILDKKSLYAGISWNKAQEAEFSSFFKQYYGRSFSNRWHKLYQSINGVFCTQYFPEILYSTKLAKELNPPKYSNVLCDKSLLKTIWGNVPGVKTPYEYVTCCNGVFRDSDDLQISKQAALERIWNAGELCMKPTVDTGSGKGVRFITAVAGKDEATGKSLLDIIESYGRNFTVQAPLKQHNSFAVLHPSSINTIRLITYICDGAVYHVPLAMRIGSGKSKVDNIHAGGLCVGIDDVGYLKAKAYRLGYGDNNETFEKHPDTGIQFHKHQLVCIPPLLQAAKKLHMKTPQLGIISWDFIVDDQHNIVLIEANLTDQSIWFPQIVNGAAAFGSNTGKLLEMICNK